MHNSERSPQEDTLLILFNMALSNLVSAFVEPLILTIMLRDFLAQVLFRNDFSLGGDITGLFQAFQSSTSILDPVPNTSLFQSTLSVIFKAG